MEGLGWIVILFIVGYLLWKDGRDRRAKEREHERFIGEVRERLDRLEKRVGVLPSQAANMQLSAEVSADEITVADPASGRFVTYHKPEGSPQLLQKRISDNGLALSAPQFLAGAWQLATQRARELGWIV